MEAPARPWGLQAEVILGGLLLGEPSSLAGALVDPTSFHGNRAKHRPASPLAPVQHHREREAAGQHWS